MHLVECKLISPFYDMGEMAGKFTFPLEYIINSLYCKLIFSKSFTSNTNAAYIQFIFGCNKRLMLGSDKNAINKIDSSLLIVVFLKIKFLHSTCLFKLILHNFNIKLKAELNN